MSVDVTNNYNNIMLSEAIIDSNVTTVQVDIKTSRSLNSLTNCDDEHIDSIVSSCKSDYLTREEIYPYLNSFSATYNFLHTNCRSLQKNFDSLSCLIAHINAPFTAIGVSETWLKAHNEDIYILQGYKFLPCSRLHRPGGGVGLYINNKYSFKQLPELTLNSDIIE